ncbi:MAG: SCP2 sterol-binding domain-containing protein [Rhizobiaceae bacterium]|nr:SCP2 sterol-binding domain-containing protein [Hyphomicrobiales bacterium]NRB30377.1 SCP2 sterol-binding domain-containing protein [Rhizobiaceae bacterium]
MSLETDPTIEQIISAMPQRFNPDAAGDLDAVLQFILTGDDGGDYFATIRDRTCTLSNGRHPDPTLTFKMAASTYVDMVMGRESGQAAFFKRKLTYSGPINLVVKVHTFFNR